MFVREQTMFEDIIQKTGFDLITENKGLYQIRDPETNEHFYIQTNGYSFLESLHRFCTSELVESKLL